MAVVSTKISGLTELAAAPAAGDLVAIVDVSEASDDDKNKKLTVTNLFNSPAIATPTGIIGDDIGIQNISTAAAIDLEDYINTSGSTALISGGVASDGGSGTIDVTAGEIYIRTTDSNIGELFSAEFAAVTGLALTDNSLNFIYAEYNSGAPQITATASPSADVHTNVILAVVFRDGTDVHISNVHIPSSQQNQLMSKRLVFVNALSRQSGSVTTETGTRNIAVTAGIWWLALIELAASALDTSSAGRFSYWHQNSGTWTEVATQAEIDNTQYNDTSSGLATLTANRYGVHWVYLAPDDSAYHVVYGVGDYTLTQAEEALAPGTLPPFFNNFHITLIAKIVIQKSASVFISVQNPFDVQFGQAVAENHDDLGNLAWTSSGHTGTATRLAGFNGSGAASEYTIDRGIQVVAFDFGTSVATGDGKFYFIVDSLLAGMDIVSVRAKNITAGVTGQQDIQIRNVTSGQDILSTKLITATGQTLDDGNAVIDTAQDDMTLDDLIAIDVDVVHTTPGKGLIIPIGFRLP